MASFQALLKRFKTAGKLGLLQRLKEPGRLLGRGNVQELQKLKPLVAQMEKESLGWSSESLAVAVQSIHRASELEMDKNIHAVGHQQLYIDTDVDIGLFILPAGHVN